MTPSSCPSDISLPQGEGLRVRALRDQGTTMGKRFITSSQTSIAKARALRRTMTRAEKKFWSLVRDNRIGVKFRRQVPIGPYIVDFFCYSAKLAVELDGSQHCTKEGKEYDFHRDQFLRIRGLTVLRFSNKEFLANQDRVMQMIWEYKHKKSLTLNPSPTGRGSG